MNNIKTEPSSHDNDDHDDMAFSSSSSSMINTATTSMYVKKKDEDHDDGNDDFNPITSPSPSPSPSPSSSSPSSSSSSHGRIYRQVKKEEEEEKEDEGSSFSSQEATTTTASSTASPSPLSLPRMVVKKQEEENDGSGSGSSNDDKPTDINCNNKKQDNNDDYYADWKVGNWCWVLPSTTCNDGNTTNYQNRTNNHSVKSEEGDTNASTNTDVPSTGSSRKRTASTRSSRNTSTTNNEDTPKNKKMRLLPPPHHPSNNKNNDTAINNSRFSRSIKDTGNSNDDINDVNNADDYESWTNGNWCWLLPTGTKKRHKQPVRAKHHRNCRASSQTPLRVNDPDPDENNEFDEDYSENDDGNEEPKKSRTGRNTTTYTNMQNERWNVMFRRLVSYKNQHKSTAVPTYYALDPELGHWVHWQRHVYMNGKISESRIRCLNATGFVWNTLDNQWDEMFNRLVTYKNQHHGSTQVPFKYKVENTQLGQWVNAQRLHYKKDELSAKRINHLESIGFVWGVHEMKWMKMYDRLVAYKKKYKTTQVPSLYTEENQLHNLGYWVYKQRVLYRDGKLLEKRVECLNSIDFEW